MEKELLVEVEHVSKKFSKNLKWSMLHGISDLSKIAAGSDLKRDKLRKEEFWALKDVSLKVYRGDLLCILGNNGSGKTTLMRLIAGIYPVDKGQITVNGKVSSLFAIKSGMHPHFSGRENIYIKGGMFGLTLEQIKQKIDWIAKNNGMVLLNTHPDYMFFDDTQKTNTLYPANFYKEILEYITTKYQDQFIHFLPCEIAEYWMKR